MHGAADLEDGVAPHGEEEEEGEDAEHDDDDGEADEDGGRAEGGRQHRREVVQVPDAQHAPTGVAAGSVQRCVLSE